MDRLYPRAKRDYSEPRGRDGVEDRRQCPNDDGLSLATLGRIVERDDGPIAEPSANARHDRAGRGARARVPSANSPADWDQVQFVDRARNDWIGVTNRRSEEKGSYAGHAREHVDGPRDIGPNAGR